MAQHDEMASSPLLLTIPQVAKTLNLGRTKVYELIWKEQLPVQNLGEQYAYPEKISLLGFRQENNKRKE